MGELLKRILDKNGNPKYGGYDGAQITCEVVKECIEEMIKEYDEIFDKVQQMDLYSYEGEYDSTEIKLKNEWYKKWLK